MAHGFDDICGYTQSELESNFSLEIESLQTKTSPDREDILAKIKGWYNGYSWGGQHRLYNPFSILNLFFHQQFANFWWETGTPTFLMKRLQQNFQFQLEAFTGGSDLFESYTLESQDNASLLFQTGYLTIKEVNQELGLYTLGYPNREVKDAMYRHLLGAFRHTTTTQSQTLFAYIKLALDRNDLDEVIQHINTLFATIPHQIFIQNQEAYFHSILHITFHAIGLFIQSEVSTSKGRVDTVLHTADRIFIIELKLDDTAQAALEQIRGKQYGDAYVGKGKEVIAVGISFSSETREVAGWIAETY